MRWLTSSEDDGACRTTSRSVIPKLPLRHPYQIADNALQGYDNQLPFQVQNHKPDMLQKLYQDRGGVNLVVANWNQEMTRTYGKLRGLYDHRVIPFITVVHMTQKLYIIQKYYPLYKTDQDHYRGHPGVGEGDDASGACILGTLGHHRRHKLRLQRFRTHPCVDKLDFPIRSSKRFTYHL